MLGGHEGLLAGGQVVVVQHAHNPQAHRLAGVPNVAMTGTTRPAAPRTGARKMLDSVWLISPYKHVSGNVGACHGAQGRIQPQKYRRGQRNHGREQQLVQIWTPTARLEHFVRPTRQQRMLHCQVRHYTRRRVPVKPLQNQKSNQAGSTRSLLSLKN